MPVLVFNTNFSYKIKLKIIMETNLIVDRR